MLEFAHTISLYKRSDSKVNLRNLKRDEIAVLCLVVDAILRGECWPSKEEIPIFHNAIGLIATGQIDGFDSTAAREELFDKLLRMTSQSDLAKIQRRYRIKGNELTIRKKTLDNNIV
jgi:hypothetical protein